MTLLVGVVGMTHLGLNYAAAFAEKGFNLLCVDEDAAYIAELSSGKLPVSEPQLDFLFQKNGDRIVFTHFTQKLSSCDVVFIAEDVPTDDAGNSDVSKISQWIAKVTPFLSQEATLVLLSQVSPGFTRNIRFPRERLYYQVETLIFGCAVERALNPERYIVGSHDPKVPLPSGYQALLSAFDCPILKMNYESAELAKIAINLFLVSSVTTTNLLSELCESMGARWHEIATALRLDKRIGPYAYLTPGLGISGGNLERDLNTVIKLGERYATDTTVVSAWLHHSRHQRDWVLRCLQQWVLDKIPQPNISLLGLSYKPNTHSLKNSPSIDLLKKLTRFNVRVHDPVASITLDFVTVKTSVQEAIQDADVVIIMTPWPEYQMLSLEYVCAQMRGFVVIDPFSVLKKESTPPDSILYFTLGEKTGGSVIKEELNYV